MLAIAFILLSIVCILTIEGLRAQNRDIIALKRRLADLEQASDEKAAREYTAAACMEEMSRRPR